MNAPVGPPIAEADLARRMQRCTQCAACKPGCPTYDVTLLEGHSGRGRLILARGILEGALEADEDVRNYLSTCTRCGWCESVCPVGIPVVALVEAALGAYGEVAPRSGPDMPDLDTRAAHILAADTRVRWPEEITGPVVFHRACGDRYRGAGDARFHELVVRSGAPLLDVKQPHCCGGALPFSAEYPGLARELGMPWIQSIIARGARTLVSNDTACLEHFRRLGFEADGRRLLSAGELLELLGG